MSKTSIYAIGEVFENTGREWVLYGSIYQFVHISLKTWSETATNNEATLIRVTWESFEIFFINMIGFKD